MNGAPAQPNAHASSRAQDISMTDTKAACLRPSHFGKREVRKTMRKRCAAPVAMQGAALQSLPQCGKAIHIIATLAAVCQRADVPSTLHLTIGLQVRSRARGGASPGLVSQLHARTADVEARFKGSFTSMEDITSWAEGDTLDQQGDSNLKGLFSTACLGVL